MAIPSEIPLINTDYVKKLTALNDKVDSNYILAALYVSQDKWIAPILGDALILKLKTDTAAGTISGNYLILRDQYVAKALVWYIMVEILPNLVYKYDNGTLAQRVSDDTQPVSSSEMKEHINRARDNAQFYATKLNDYLCANSSLFTEYSNNVWPQKGPTMPDGGANTFRISEGNSASSFTGAYPPKRLSQLP